MLQMLMQQLNTMQQQQLLMQAQLTGRAGQAKITFPTFDPKKESFSNYRTRVEGVVAPRYPDLCGARRTTVLNAASSSELSAHLLVLLLSSLMDSFRDNPEFAQIGVKMWCLVCELQEPHTPKALLANIWRLFSL